MFDSGSLLHLFAPLNGRRPPSVLSLGITLLALIPNPNGYYDESAVDSAQLFLHIDQESVPGYSRVAFAQAPACDLPCLLNYPSLLIADYFPILTPLLFRRGSLIFEGIGAPTLSNGSKPPANAVMVERTAVTTLSGPVIPEPGTALLAAAGLAVIAKVAAKRR